MLKRFNLISTFMVAIFAIGILISSCEGPTGPAGKDGTNGTNGSNGTAVCQKCHSSSAEDVVLKFAQYDLSKHGTGEVYIEEAGRATTCGGCHNGDGFAQAARLGQNDATSMGTSAINCQACHEIHTAYDSTDWKLRQSSAITFRQSATPGMTFDFGGAGNTCAKCHQARIINRPTSKIDATKDSIARNAGGYSRLGPHYGVMANILTGVGIEPMTGLTIPTSNPHTSLAKGCVSCHMAKDTTNTASGGHTFRMTQANFPKMSTADWAKNCYCHDKAKIAKAEITKQLAADIAGIRRIIIDANLLDTTQAVTAEGYVVLGEYIKADTKTYKYLGKDTVSALINYQYVAKDRSNGAHNPELMKNIVAALKNFFK